ncbi:MAG TPA: FkbM family methyltransferase [Bacteroidia bacterium]|nr:FkbM family methyltransferase [Bacteroidia bacterium]
MKTLDKLKNLMRVIWLDSVLRIFTQNKNYDSFIGKMVPNLNQYPKGTVRLIEQNGIKFEVDLHDYYGHLMYFGFNDPSQSALLALCKPGDVIIDIGTNIGFSLLSMAKISGTVGFVLGFEPDPVNFRQLEKNIALNNFTNIKVTQTGLGDEPGKFKLENIVEFNSGGKRIVAAGNAALSDYAEVEINTLDNFLESNVPLSKIDLIKIDVEGFEFNVLKGATNAIRNYSPVLFIELDDNNLRQQSSGAKELIHFLAENGYAIINAESKSSVDKETDFRNCHYDIICRRKSHT